MNLCKRGMSTREVILIKIKNKTKTLNEFLNIKNIEDNYLTTLDGQVILFIKICPINTELFSEEELENKMNSMSIEFSNEQYPYTFFIIPRKVDIADFVNEQQELKENYKMMQVFKQLKKELFAHMNLLLTKI